VADSEAGEDNFGQLEVDQGIETLLIDRSLLEGKEDQKSCQEERMRERQWALRSCRGEGDGSVMLGDCRDCFAAKSTAS